MHDGYDTSQLALERRVEVSAALDGSKAVAICQLGENADITVVFELDA